MKARRCIMKAGSLDNYLLNTRPKTIGSKFGLYLRKLIKAKQANPSVKTPYVPGSATCRRKRTHKKWHLNRVSPVFTPAHVKANRDLSEFYEKRPGEMSRYELADLERII